MGEPEDVDEVALAREALTESLAALEQSAGRLTDLMDALAGRVQDAKPKRQKNRDAEVAA